MSGSVPASLRRRSSMASARSISNRAPSTRLASIRAIRFCGYLRTAASKSWSDSSNRFRCQSARAWRSSGTSAPNPGMMWRAGAPDRTGPDVSVVWGRWLFWPIERCYPITPPLWSPKIRRVAFPGCGAHAAGAWPVPQPWISSVSKSGRERALAVWCFYSSRL